MNEFPFSKWLPGDPVAGEQGVKLGFDADTLSKSAIYKLIIGSVVPRPIGFVSTVSLQGQQNLAPFSFFNGVSAEPACLSLSFARKPDGEKKDSLRNIEETGEFVVNIVTTEFTRAMVHTASLYPYGVSEMEEVGFTPEPSVKIKPPRVKQSPVQFECVLYRSVSIGDDLTLDNTLIIGRIVHVHVAERVYRDGKIDVRALSPAARLGGTDYAALDFITSISIPSLPGDGSSKN